MADREVMAKLFEATTDDDSKVDPTTLKAIVKAALVEVSTLSFIG